MRPTSRELAVMYAEYFGAAFVGTAAFPRIAYWLRWPTRLGPRGFVAYVAFRTLILFSRRQWLLPFAERGQAKRDRVVQALGEKLGREPTLDEIVAHCVAEHEA